MFSFYFIITFVFYCLICLNFDNKEADWCQLFIAKPISVRYLSMTNNELCILKVYWAMA